MKIAARGAGEPAVCFGFFNAVSGENRANFLGAQASLPAWIPAMTDWPIQATKDACAPRKAEIILRILKSIAGKYAQKLIDSA
jgi:hypothetical protein